MPKLYVPDMHITAKVLCWLLLLPPSPPPAFDHRSGPVSPPAPFLPHEAVGDPAFAAQIAHPDA